MKKVALYCRVSSEKQEDERTIESQIAELQEICKGHQIVKTYLDDGWSGGLLDRPGLDQLRLDAKEKMFEAVHVHAVDRISRNLYHQTIIVEELKKSDVEIFIKDKPIADTPDGRFMFNILGSVAEYEKEKILERTRRGKIFKAKHGIVGYRACFGYDYIKKDSSGKNGYYVINKKEAEIINQIFDLYIKSQSLCSVQREMNEKGILPRKSSMWHRSTIGHILRNTTLIGCGYYNKRESVMRDNGKKYSRKIKNGVRIRPKEEWIPIKFPQIVDKPRFDIAQEILSKRYRPWGAHKYFYLLTGLLTCSRCGSTFVGGGNGRNTYYRCTDRRKRIPFQESCRAKYIRTGGLDLAVWEATSKLLKDPKILTAHISQLADEIVEGRKNIKEKKDLILSDISSLSIKKDRLLEVYTEGKIEKEQFLNKMEKYNKDENDLKEKLNELESAMEKTYQRPQIMKNLRHFCKMACKRIDSLSPEEIQRVLRYLICEIKLDSNSGRALVTGRVPVDNTEMSNLCYANSRLPYAFSKPCVSHWKMVI